MTDWSNRPAVERKPGKISGAMGVHRNTSTGICSVQEPRSGATIDEFVEWFPGVDKKQVRAVLEHEARALRRRWPIEAAVRSGHARAVAGRLPAHSADTLAENGWSDKDNGELLDVAEREEYDVLVTTDQGLRYQQNL